MEKSEIRKDYFRDKYVIIAPKRAKRPQKVLQEEKDHGICYFCPENLSSDEVVNYVDKNDDGNWEIISIDNRFPALTLENSRAYGKQEVLIETRRHDFEIHEFSIDHIIRVFDAYIDRFEALKNIDDIRHVIVFKNEGGKAGASIPHSHSQIYALSIIPPQIKEELEDYARYRLDNFSCPYCDVIKKETGKRRVIWEDENLFVLSPFASDAPFGAWFIPKRHIRFITELKHDEKVSLAKAMKMVLLKLDELGISYNYFFENAVNNEDYHMHLKLAPRPNIWAGLELGTGIIINSIPPEYAARYYRGEITPELAEDKKHIKIG